MNNRNFQNSYQQNTYQQNNFGFGLKSNKIFVNGLDDALNRVCDRNSEMVYFDSSRDLLYNIITDEWGQKRYRVIQLTLYEQKNEEDRMTELLNRIKVLEDKVLGVNNGVNEQSANQSNGSVG